MLERPHVVEPVRQLDYDDACIMRHGEQQLAIVLDLLLGVRAECHLTDLGDTIDDVGDFFTQLGAQVFQADECIFDNVMHQRGNNRRRIEMKIRDDLRDFYAMRNVLFARRAFLARVRLLTVPIGVRDQLEVQAVAIVLDLVAQAQRQCRQRFRRFGCSKRWVHL